MALRQIMLNKKIQEKRNELREVVERLGDYAKREEELELSIDEAKTEEETKAVEEEIEKFEEEKKYTLKEKETLEQTISVLEEELDQTREKKPKDGEEKRERKMERVGENNMNVIKRGAFYGKTMEFRERFLKQEEVRTFLDTVKELKSQNRAVSGSDLTIPTIALELLRDNMNRYSKLIEVIKVKPIAGKGRQNIAGKIPEGIWTEAIASLNELEIEFAQIEMDGFKVGGYIAIENSTLEDSELNLAEEIFDTLGQAIGIAIDKAIIYGTGTKMPLGIVTRLAQTEKPADWGIHAPKWTDLHTSNIKSLGILEKKGAEFFASLIEELGVAEENYSSGMTCWVMNSKTKKKIMSKAITFDASGTLVAMVNKEMPVIGGKIITLPFIANDDIIGGYGSLYILAERKGGTFALSDHAKFIEDMTVFKGTARYDGKPVFGEGFVAVNLGSATVTTSVAFAPDKGSENVQVAKTAKE